MQWLKNYKGGDGDGASDISGLETNSVTRPDATTAHYYTYLKCM